MAWATPVIHATGDILTASDWNINSNDLSFLGGVVGAQILTSQTTSSTAFTDLATVGPAVTVTTGANAIVTISANLNNNTAGDVSEMGYAVSGATTIAAADATSLQLGQQSVVSFGMQASFTMLCPGLTAGSNTFTAKYKVNSGASIGSFAERYIVVQPLP